ncbi:hypothetical protein [Brevibacillus sp. H7]|jgi:hypothetical protein
MLTPCIYKRGIIWLLFFVLSFLIVPFFTEEGPAPQSPATNNVSSK